MTLEQYTGMFFTALVIVGLTWQGLNLIRNPKEWLERYGRSTADKHIRATRFIGWMSLGMVLIILLQIIRGLLRLRQ